MLSAATAADSPNHWPDYGAGQRPGRAIYIDFGLNIEHPCGPYQRRNDASDGRQTVDPHHCSCSNLSSHVHASCCLPAISTRGLAVTGTKPGNDGLLASRSRPSKVCVCPTMH